MDEPCKHYANWKKLDTKFETYDSTYVKLLEQKSYWKQKAG